MTLNPDPMLAVAKQIHRDRLRRSEQRRLVRQFERSHDHPSRNPLVRSMVREGRPRLRRRRPAAAFGA